MPDEFDNSEQSPTESGSRLAVDDGVPVLREVVKPSDNGDIPTLDAKYAITLPTQTPHESGLSSERIAEIADTLQLTLHRELDYAIDGAVYERLQSAMEDVAASVKKQIHEQLEQKLPELIEQTLGKDN
jgi:hypothetical protein